MVSIQKYITPSCLISLMVLVCVLEIDGSRPCNDDQYLHTLLKKCMPCKEICKPLHKSYCQSKCTDYIRSLTACNTEQYWETEHGACFDCTVICDPPSGDKCKSKCSGYIESLRSLNTVTVSNLTTKTTLTTERWTAHHVTVIALTVAGTLSLPIAITFGVWCYRSKRAKRAGNNINHRDDKMPIEEVGNRGSRRSDQLLRLI